MGREFDDVLTEAFLKQKYVKEQKSCRTIVKEVGAKSDVTVRNYLVSNCAVSPLASAMGSSHKKNASCMR